MLIPHLHKALFVTCNANMNFPDTIELKNIDPEDIGDVLLKVEKSFGFKFGDTELKDVKTFGELCDIITSKVQGDNANDCTTQQAFYKVRSAIADTLHIDNCNISLDTDLERLFPRQNRRGKINELQSKLDIPIDILDIKAWLGWTIFSGIILSLLMFFFKWQFALSGLVVFILVGWTSNKFYAKEFEIKTVAQLTEKIARENYLKARRNSATINRNEIEEKVKELFKHDLDLEAKVLTRQATFV